MDRDGLALRARLGAAAPSLSAESSAWLAAWLDLLDTSSDGAGLRVSLDPAVTEMTLALEDDVGALATPLAVLLAKADADDAVLTEVLGSAEALGARALGTWLTVGAEEPAVGWYAGASLPLDAVSAWAGDDAARLLSTASRTAKTSVVARAGEVLGSGDRISAFSLALDQPTPLDAAVDVCATLRIRAPEPALEAPLRLEPLDGAWSVSWWCSGSEVLRASIHAPGVPSRTRLILAEAAGVADLTALARAEGALGEPRCDAMELRAGGEEPSVAMWYSVCDD